MLDISNSTEYVATRVKSVLANYLGISKMSINTKNVRVALAAVACTILSFMQSNAQISQTSQTASLKPTVRELITTSKAQFAIVSKDVENSELHATVVLTNPDGSTIGGYGAPSVTGNEAQLNLWRDFISANLNMPAQVEGFSVTENVSDPGTTYAVGFVLDHSPSTTVPRAIRMQRAVQTALTKFAPVDFVSVIKFTGRVNVEVPVTNDKEEYASKFLVNGLNMRVTGSAVFDAAIRGINEIASTTADRRLVILFTDGEDNSSSSTMQDVIDLAKKTNTQIHTISYGVGNQAVLTSIAKQTGGRTHQLRDVYDFDKVFMGIYASLRHSYDIVVRTASSSQVASNLSPSSIISSSAASQGSIQPTEVLSLMPKNGVQVSSSTSRADQSLTVNVDLKFEGEASSISAADLLTLDSIATVLVQRADLALEIVPGHFGNAPTTPDGVVIAQRRASAVRDLLIRRGVHPSRVQGFSSRPSSVPQPLGTSSKTSFVFTKM